MQRRAGIFLHPTSLPSPFGIGDLGAGAFSWIDLLARYKQTVWQMCPLGPVGYGFSPYNCHSTFAGNPLLISPELLHNDGLLTGEELTAYPALPADYVDFGRVSEEKEKLFRTAFSRFRGMREFSAFCKKESYWLDDYSLYMAIKKSSDGKPWNQWKTTLKRRKPASLEAVRIEQSDEIRYQKFLQYLFMKQWKEVHRYARKCGVTIFGDLPYYVAYDSSDVWASQRTFRLDRSRDPVDVGGVPPDYFSAGGQLWGNPVYDWPKLKKDEYSWWVQRIRKSFELFDWVRIDHFRAFESFWAVPYGSTDAINGRWVPGPGNHFFQTLRKTIKKLPLIAEDLGMITKEVNDLRTAIGIPGMRVLQFAFDGGVDNPHRPHNIDRDSVIYTGTHDNDTSIGWLATASAGLKDFICRYLGSPGDRIMDHIISTAYMSVADWCILPFQDVLLLDGYHRMNTPGTADNNWRWRFTYPMVNEDRLNTIAYVTDLYGRYTPDGKS